MHACIRFVSATAHSSSSHKSLFFLIDFTQTLTVLSPAAGAGAAAVALLSLQVSGTAFMGQPVIPRPHLASPAPGLSPHGHRPTGATLRPRAAAGRALGVSVEANLFSRLVRVVKAYVSNFTEQFEDPEVLLDRVTDEMNEDLIKMRQATAKVSCAGKGDAYMM